MTTRRTFLKTGSAALGAAVIGPRILPASAPVQGQQRPALYTDPATRELMMEALDAAKRAGAQWADVRISRNRSNSIQTRERQVTDVVDTDTTGCGVRVLVNGCWGFAATEELTKAGVGAAAQEAAAIAKANRVAQDRRVTLAPAPSLGNVTWRSAYTTDPFTVAV